MEKSDIGQEGQSLTEHFLRKAGLFILERNWRCRLGEIDLVLQDKRRNLVFIEVKTLIAPKFSFQPEDHFTLAKQRKLRQLALAYLNYYNLSEVSYQIDLVAIELNEDLSVKDVRHYPNVIEEL